MRSKSSRQSNEAYTLTAEYIEHLHDYGVVFFYGGNEPVGEHECIDRNLLASSPLQPFQSAFGADAYPTIYDKAARLFFSIAGGHIFTNGNKRTAVLALEHFLVANAILLTIPNNDMEMLARDTASHRIRGGNSETMQRRIASAIRDNSIPFKELRTFNLKDYNFWQRIKRKMWERGSAVEHSTLERRASRQL